MQRPREFLKASISGTSGRDRLSSKKLMRIHSNGFSTGITLDSRHRLDSWSGCKHGMVFTGYLEKRDLENQPS